MLNTKNILNTAVAIVLFLCLHGAAHAAANCGGSSYNSGGCSGYMDGGRMWPESGCVSCDHDYCNNCTCAKCGDAAGKTYSSAPSSDLCGYKNDVYGSVTDDGSKWVWTCKLHHMAGYTTSCSASKAPVTVNGSCGSANNGSYSSKPTVALCSAGSASTVTGSGPWSWSCTSPNGGSSASCHANLLAVTPVCALSFSSSQLPVGVAGTLTLQTMNATPNTGVCVCNGLDGGNMTMNPNTPYPAGPFSNSGTKKCTCTVKSLTNAVGTCQASLDVFKPSCAGSIPEDSTMCGGDDSGLTSDSEWHNVGTSKTDCTSAKCEYYTESGSITIEYSCSGSIPAGSTMCSGDDSGLTGGFAWHNVGTSQSSCTPAKCEYFTSSDVRTACGTRHRTYTQPLSDWPESSTYCAPGYGVGADAPAYPRVGGTASWTCSDGTVTATCSAKNAYVGDVKNWREVK